MARRFIPLPQNTWRQIVEKHTRHALDELTTELMASLEDVQDAISDIDTTIEETDNTHDLLQADVHLDTETNPPLPGALVVGEPADSVDFSLFWADGLPIDILPTEVETGGVKFWADGLPFQSVQSLTDGDVKWVRLEVGANGQVLTSTGTAVEWEDPDLLTPRPYASAPMATAQAIPLDTPTLIVLDTPDVDTGPFWSGSNPTRFTVPTGQAGAYIAIGQITWTLSNLGPLRARLLKNGTVFARDEDGNQNGDATITQNLSSLVVLAESDYVELEAFQSGTVGTVTAGTGETFLQLVRQA